METLPTNLQKLISENAAAVREALVKLRKSGEPQEILDRDGKRVVIKPLTQERPAA